MTFAAPWAFGIAVAASIATVLWHLISTQRPERALLPTARFVPAGEAQAISRTVRPTDLLLLALRLLALLLLGAAFAGPRFASSREGMVRVIVADASRAAQSDVGDSVAALWRGGDRVVWFDSSADVAVDSGGRRASRAVKGRLSAGLVRAHQRVPELSQRSDSLELVIVSPLLREEMDAAVVPLAARWVGRVRVVRSHAPAARNAMPQKTVTVEPTPADSASARAGAAVVWWPVVRDAKGPAAHPDAVWAGDATVVGQLTRVAIAHSGHIVARWSDGEPAASEQPVGAGCVRRVSIGVPRAGDTELQPSFVALKQVLEMPCGGVGESATDAQLRGLARDWPRPDVRLGARLHVPPSSTTTLWLLALAAGALLLELFVCRQAGVEP
ncbi:hypothetical protein EBR44_00880 [bacterium]|nr:hypothetical protein [bacterium]